MMMNFALKKVNFSFEMLNVCHRIDHLYAPASNARSINAARCEGVLTAKLNGEMGLQ